MNITKLVNVTLTAAVAGVATAIPVAVAVALITPGSFIIPAAIASVAGILGAVGAGYASHHITQHALLTSAKQQVKERLVNKLVQNMSFSPEQAVNALEQTDIQLDTPPEISLRADAKNASVMATFGTLFSLISVGVGGWLGSVIGNRVKPNQSRERHEQTMQVLSAIRHGTPLPEDLNDKKPRSRLTDYLEQVDGQDIGAAIAAPVFGVLSHLLSTDQIMRNLSSFDEGYLSAQTEANWQRLKPTLADQQLAGSAHQPSADVMLS